MNEKEIRVDLSAGVRAIDKRIADLQDIIERLDWVRRYLGAEIVWRAEHIAPDPEVRMV